MLTFFRIMGFLFLFVWLFAGTLDTYTYHVADGWGIIAWFFLGEIAAWRKSNDR